jgi:hypothetical protein
MSAKNNGGGSVLLLLLLCGGFTGLIVTAPTETNQIVKEGLENMSLTTVGTEIIRGGTSFYLAGASADRNEWLNGYFTSADVTTIKNAGGNAVEIHTINFLNDIMPTKNVINTAFFTDTLDDLVTDITSQGLYCIINQQDLTTWSIDYPYIPAWMLDAHGYGSAPYSVATQKQAFKDFINVTSNLHDDNRLIWMNTWAWIANRYKTNPYVILSLMNEPMNGAGFVGAENTTWCGYYATFIEQTIDIIRVTGAANLIFVDKPYSANLWSDIVDVSRTNVVWEDHSYISDTSNYAAWQSIIDSMVTTYVTGFGKPLFIGEYATLPLNRANWQTDFSNMVAYLSDASKFSGRSFHSWGMLFGEYDSVNGSTGSLSSIGDNMALTSLIFNIPVVVVLPLLASSFSVFTLSDSSVLTDEPVYCSVTVTGAGATPTGTVTFYTAYNTPNWIQLGVPTSLDAGGSTTSINFYPGLVGIYLLKAVYNGDLVYSMCSSMDSILTITNPVVATSPAMLGLLGSVFTRAEQQNVGDSYWVRGGWIDGMWEFNTPMQNVVRQAEKVDVGDSYWDRGLWDDGMWEHDTPMINLRTQMEKT